MPDLEPITRKEKLLDGEDLTPITRKEQFIKRIYDKTQEIPEPITREEMFLKKAGEGGGGDIDLQTLNVTENGTVIAPSGVAYNKVVTNVPIPTPPENAYLLEEYEDVPTDIASFTASDAPLKSLTASIVPVQSGSGDPSPTNVRPITGWTEEVIGVCGKNWLNPNISAWSTSVSYRYINDIIPKNQTFRMTFEDNDTTVDITGCYLGWVKDGNNANLGSRWVIFDGTIRAETKNTSTQDGSLLQSVFVYPNNEETFNKLFSRYKIQIEIGETATTYEPYAGTTYTIPFTDSQGNSVEVYGGSVDVVNGGEQSNKYVKKTLYDAWSVASNGVFYLDGKATDGKVGALNTEADVLCSIYPKGLCVGASSGAIQNPKTLCIQELNGIRFLVYDTSFESLEDFNAYVAQNGIEVRYELATPTTFYTQPTAIKSLDGENNVFASTGQIETLEYFAKEE